MKKRNIMLIVCMTLIFILVGMFIKFKIERQLPERPTKEVLINFFKTNKDVFDRISRYLSENDYKISIDTRNGSSINDIARISASEGAKSFTISNEVVNDITIILYKQGFVEIYEEGDFIYFDKSLGFQWHQALVYSKSGKSPPLHRVRDFENIGDNWFYYYGE